MMKVCVLIALLVGVVSPAFAEKLKGPPGSNVEMEVPAGWKSQTKGKGGEGLAVLLSPDEEASLVIAVSEAKNLDKAGQALETMLGKLVTETKMGKPGKVTINGMPGLGVLGQGKVKSKPVNLGVMILQAKSGKILFVIGVVNTAKNDQYKKVFETAIQSIKPTA